MDIDEQIAMINEVSIESIQSFYDEYYGVTNKASLVAIGSMDVDMVKTYFEDNFSDFKSDKPFSVIENVPEYPGCEKGSNSEKRKCMSAKIAKFVQRKFNTDLAGDLGLSGRQRINVIFKIDKRGNVVGVRSRAPHPRLEQEAARVINMLPKMKPGRQRGKPVIVPYSLPITFQVQD